jgi:hypothetical protein
LGYFCTMLLDPSSLTNVWDVILGVSVSTMPRAPSLRSLFLLGCVSLWLSAQRSRHFTQRFLLTMVIKHQFKIWMSCSLQVLSMPSRKDKFYFQKWWRNGSIKCTKEQRDLPIVWILCQLDNVSEECGSLVVWYSCWRKLGCWCLFWRNLWTIFVQVRKWVSF